MEVKLIIGSANPSPIADSNALLFLDARPKARMSLLVTPFRSATSRPVRTRSQCAPQAEVNAEARGNKRFAAIKGSQAPDRQPR